MAYIRPPTAVKAGLALRQNPPPTPLDPAGVLDVILDAEIATTTSLGVVQVGSGLSITPEGILSATGGGGDTGYIDVYLTASNYTATNDDYYIGIIGAPTIVTLPPGTLGKVFIIKNQLQGGGSVKVIGSNGQLLDTSISRSLGSEASIMMVFDGTRWNII